MAARSLPLRRTGSRQSRRHTREACLRWKERYSPMLSHLGPRQAYDGSVSEKAMSGDGNRHRWRWRISGSKSTVRLVRRPGVIENLGVERLGGGDDSSEQDGD